MTFAASFRTLTGHDPFPWQDRLFRQFSGGGPWPKAIDLPTGLGKTSVMAVWLLALAADARAPLAADAKVPPDVGASSPLAANSRMPRRLVYVVDRRAVVDQASAFAARLAQADVEGLPARLRVSTLRGSLADNREWLADPAAPALVVGTVDMIGSRLLFSGYGVSRAMRPFHAALLGTDALVVLDEAHLSQPFAALLRSVERMTRGGVRLMALSATGNAPPDFTLMADDAAHPVVAERIHAHKTIAFEAAADAKGIAERALALVADAPARVAVFVTSRELARRVHEVLAKRAAAILLVGERRGRERDAVAAQLAAAGFTGAAEPTAAPAFVVATAAGEVGIDLDADHIVADLVPFERMVQRLGRVNRRGGPGRRASVVVLDLAPAGLEPAEAERRRLTRELLATLPAPDGLPVASPANLSALRAQSAEGVARASTPPPLHPPLTLPLVEALAMTSLAEHSGRPDVGPWLRGWVDDEPQTSVVWRTHLPVVVSADPGKDDVVRPEEVATFFEVAPPQVSERLDAESLHVADWLLQMRKALEKGRRSFSESLSAHRVLALALTQALELREDGVLTRRDLMNPRLDRNRLARRLAGAILVVDARLAGLTDGLLNSDEPEPPVTADGPERSTADTDPWGETKDGRPVVRFRVDRHPPGEVPTPSGWRFVRGFTVAFNDAGEPTDVLSVFVHRGTATSEDSRSVTKDPVTLADHIRHVVGRVESLLGRLDLPPDEAAAVRLAAELHDTGKAAAVWQRAMNAPPGGPWAKTTGGNGRALNGYRHEFGSLLAAEHHPAVAALPEELRDLVLHLVAAHHGRARPLVPADGCTEGPPVAVLAGKAGEAARRYASLSKRHGAWGLAYREAILRAADQAASSAEAGGAGAADDADGGRAGGGAAGGRASGVADGGRHGRQ